MDRRKRILILFTAGLGALLVFLTVLFVLLPLIVQLEPVQTAVLEQVSRRTAGEVRFQSLDLDIFPTPRLRFHGGTVSRAGKLKGSLGSLELTPRVLPLFLGTLKIARLRLEDPDLTMLLPEGMKKTGAAPSLPSTEPLAEKITAVLNRLAGKVPGLALVIEDGALGLRLGDALEYRLRDIQARMHLPPGEFTVDLTCSSNLWQNLHLKGAADPEHFQTAAQVAMTDFRPEGLTAYLLPEADIRLGASHLNLKLDLFLGRDQGLQAEVEASHLDLTLHRRGNKVLIQGKTLKGGLQQKGAVTTVALTELDLQQPRVRATGHLHLDPSRRLYSLELKAEDLVVSSARKATLALAGDMETTRRIFNTLRAGSLPRIRLNSQGASPRELGRLQNMHLAATLEDATVFVPNCGLELKEAGGQVELSRGILKGSNLQARLGDSRSWKGNLVISLVDHKPHLHLETLIRADLAEVPPLLEGLVKNEKLLSELALISDLQGKATGKLTLGESLGSLQVGVEVSDLRLKARYQHLPYMLEISRGELSYRGSTVSVNNMEVSLGGSSFSGLSARLEWEGKRSLELASANARLILEQIHPWLSSLKPAARILRDVGALRGIVALQDLHFKGPLFSPNDWEFQVKGDVEQLFLESTLLPGPLGVPRGTFYAEPQKLFLSEWHLGLLDSSLEVSGELEGYLGGPPRVDVTVTGSTGTEALGWAARTAGLPPEFKIRSPLSISRAHLIREGQSQTSISGSFAVGEGPQISLAVHLSPDQVRVENLLLRDEQSKASISLAVNRDRLDLAFAGVLTGATLDAVFVDNRFLEGWVKGDFKASILSARPAASRAEGKLEAAGIDFTWLLETAAALDSISLKAGEDGLELESAVLTLGESRLNLEGRLEFAASAFNVDLDLAADHLWWDRLRQLRTRKLQGGKDGPQANFLPLPFRGTLRLNVDHFTYGKYTWSPVHGEIAFTPENLTVQIFNAALCGTSTFGTLQVSPRELALQIRPVALDGELNSTLSCLFAGEKLITGAFNFQGNISGRGPPERIAEAMQGKLSFSAREGRIYRLGLLAKIFALLNVTEIFRGDVPDLHKQGFGYKSIEVEAILEQGKLRLERAVIDGSSMEIAAEGSIDLGNQKLDLIILVAPLKTIDYIIKHIPIVREILGGNLVTVPVKASGDLHDPRVVPLSPSAVGSRLLGMFERTIKLPVKIVEPLLPKQHSEPSR